MKPIASFFHFLQYHNFVLLLGFVALAGTSALAMTDLSQTSGASSSEIAPIVVIDTSALRALQLDTFTPEPVLVSVTESETDWLVVYRYDTYGLVDAAWQRVVHTAELTVPKTELGSETLESYIYRQLQEVVAQEHRYLTRVQTQALTQHEVYARTPELEGLSLTALQTRTVTPRTLIETPVQTIDTPVIPDVEADDAARGVAVDNEETPTQTIDTPVIPDVEADDAARGVAVDNEETPTQPIITTSATTINEQETAGDRVEDTTTVDATSVPEETESVGSDSDMYITTDTPLEESTPEETESVGSDSDMYITTDTPLEESTQETDPASDEGSVDDPEPTVAESLVGPSEIVGADEDI